MTWGCIDAARRFRRDQHLRFVIGEQPVGWIRADDVRWLTRWPDVFTISERCVVLADAFDTVQARSAALGSVIGALAAHGRIRAWRNETYAIRNAFDDPPLAFIERAASRFFGTTTYAVHLNGVVGGFDRDVPPLRLGGGASPVAPRGADGEPYFWIARRSDTKPTDPGMLDNLVGGGIGWGLPVFDTLVKEAYEESGIDALLVRMASAGRTLHILQEIDEGTQAEQLFVYDLLLPDDFAPRSIDGEVAEHQLVSRTQLLDVVRAGRMTVDASLATLDCLLRRGWLDSAECGAFDILLQAPGD
ncbi:NUDIX hydrolase [Mycetohabitans sp. B46]|uniref:NUDIX hydrolase n=1 Tax=Mycetohabitans sp. B46 TaxID=2772536 RepID=UPI00307F457D